MWPNGNIKSISSKAASGLYRYTLSYRNVEKFDPGCSPIVKLGHHTTSRLIGVGHTNLPSKRSVDMMSRNPSGTSASRIPFSTNTGRPLREGWGRGLRKIKGIREERANKKNVLWERNFKNTDENRER